LGGVPVDERTIERMVVLQFLFIATVITTSLAVALTGFSVVDALGMAVHATATGGPVRSIDGIPQDPANWGVLSRLVLIPAMVAGRMAIFPVLVAATSVGAVTQQKLHFAGRRVRKNLRRS
jgi:Trk-type K+ transport system membrane component